MPGAVSAVLAGDAGLAVAVSGSDFEQAPSRRVAAMSIESDFIGEFFQRHAAGSVAAHSVIGK